MRLGIDFGTTHTVIAHADRGNFPVLTFEAPDGDVVDHIPTLAVWHDNALVFGLEARDALLKNAEAPSLRSFKRVLSDPGVTAHSLVRIGPIELPVLDVATRFLQSVARNVRQVTGAAEDELLEAVVAVPANAFGAQRFLTLDAFRRGGFHVVSLVNEPSAAGFEYVHRHPTTLSAKRTSVVVYDMGGGTFDASLVRVSDESHEAVTTAGINDLGGDDFDRILRTLVLQKLHLPESALDEARLARLLQRCREAKEKLITNSKRVVVDIEGIEGLRGEECGISAQDYYDACQPLVQKSIDAMAPVLEAAGFSDPDNDALAGVYVVGGGSALPAVAKALRDQFGRRLHRSPYPAAATAIGLAICADESAAPPLRDRLARHFGVFREAEGGTRITFDPIFRKDTALPPAGQLFSHTRAYRPAHNVGQLRFVECQAVDATGTPSGVLMPFADVLVPYDPTLRGDADLRLVQVERTSVSPQIEERYDLDSDGLISVTVKDMDSGWTRTYRIGK